MQPTPPSSTPVDLSHELRRTDAIPASHTKLTSFKSISRPEPSPARAGSAQFHPGERVKHACSSITCNLQHDLADMVAGLHAGMRVSRLRKREGTVDYRPDTPLLDQRQYMLLDGARYSRLIGDGACAQCRAGMGEP